MFTTSRWEDSESTPSLMPVSAYFSKQGYFRGCLFLPLPPSPAPFNSIANSTPGNVFPPLLLQRSHRQRLDSGRYNQLASHDRIQNLLTTQDTNYHPEGNQLGSGSSTNDPNNGHPRVSIGSVAQAGAAPPPGHTPTSDSQHTMSGSAARNGALGPGWRSSHRLVSHD